MQKWVKALRSGKYKQTKSELKDNNGYCCLGVLCEISGKSEFTKSNTGEFSFDEQTSILPASVMHYANIKDSLGRNQKTGKYLCVFNDEQSKSFK